MNNAQKIKAMRKMLDELELGIAPGDAEYKLGGAYLGLRDAVALTRFDREQWDPQDDDGPNDPEFLGRLFGA